MFIVEKDGGETILAVAVMIKGPYPDPNAVVHNLPNWDWSLVDFAGIDRTNPGWLSLMKWDGKNIVKK